MTCYCVQWDVKPLLIHLFILRLTAEVIKDAAVVLLCIVIIPVIYAFFVAFSGIGTFCNTYTYIVGIQ